MNFMKTIVAAGLVAASTSAFAADITGAGATFPFPIYSKWADAYKKETGNGLNYQSIGSGGGIKQIEAKTVTFGATDMPLKVDQLTKDGLVQWPMVMGAIVPVINLEGVKPGEVVFDGETLADIYLGKITKWDDPAIKKLNPNVKLPHNDIIPVRRSDGSGDTFVFTQYLTFSTQSWEDKLGYGTTIAWPAVAGGLTAEGNLGVLQTVQKTPYSISYVGVSFHAEITEAGLGTSLLKSYSGEFLLPTPETVAAAAASLSPRTPPDERLTLVNAPGANAYPLVNYEYAIVSTKQADPATATAIRKFLLWAIAPDEANEKYLEDAHFIALPAHIWVLSHDQIETIK